jgi:hypothetical protein
MRSERRFVVSGGWLQTYPGLSRAPRACLLDGLERLASIRADIAKTAKVVSMPLIEVVPYIWEWVHGRMEILRAGDTAYLGVRLPAQTALCTDHSAVRAVLVHEFAHCFYYATEVLDRFETPGVKADSHLDLDYLEQRPDAELHVNPHDWFGESDAAAFAQSGDPRTDVIDLVTVKERLRFNVSTPPPGCSAIIRIEDDWKAHIRTLRHSAKAVLAPKLAPTCSENPSVSAGAEPSA